MHSAARKSLNIQEKKSPKLYSKQKNKPLVNKPIVTKPAPNIFTNL